MTSVTSALPVADFLPYAKAGKLSTVHQQKAAILLAQLAQATKVETVKRLCDDALAVINSDYSTPKSRCSTVSGYRKAISSYFSDHDYPSQLATERKTSKGLVHQHVALNYMQADPGDYAAAQAQTTQKSAEQRDNLTAINPDAALAVLEQAATSQDWRELAAALIFASQARPSDILKAGVFKAATQYSVSFTSGLKKKGKSTTGKVFTLISAPLFIDGIARLRRAPEVAALSDALLHEIDSHKNSSINAAVQRLFGDSIPTPYGESADLSCRNLRAVGALIAYHLYGRVDQAIGRFCELQLLHDSASSAINYDDYYCIDASGNRAHVGTRQDSELVEKPISTQTTRNRLNLLTIEGIQSFGFGGTIDEQIAQVIAQARQADKLKRQLEYQQEQNRILRATAADEPAPTIDLAEVPDSELAGKKPGYAAERIRRAVLAIQRYNEQHELLADQIEINAGSLRALAAASPAAVGAYVAEHASELAAYAAAMNHPGSAGKQNRGKNITELVPMDWNN